MTFTDQPHRWALALMLLLALLGKAYLWARWMAAGIAASFILSTIGMVVAARKARAEYDRLQRLRANTREE